jgi:hypothetical protein
MAHANAALTPRARLHSRRSVPMNRSAIAFACVARTGVRMMRVSVPLNTASKAGLISTSLAASDRASSATPAQHSGERQVRELEGHSGRSCCAGCRR